VTAQTSALAPDQSPSLDISPAASSRIQILLPGETAAPGTASGKTGSPNAVTAGANYSIHARLTDAYYNAVGNGLSNVGLRLTTTDPYDAPEPDDSILITPPNTGNFDGLYTHQFQRASSTGWFVTVSTRTGPAYTQGVAGPIVVNADTNNANLH